MFRYSPEYTVAVTIKVYRLGDVEPFFTMCGWPGHFSWSEKVRIIADYFECDRDDVGSHEDDDGAELITVCGKVVGSFNHPICLEPVR